MSKKQIQFYLLILCIFLLGFISMEGLAQHTFPKAIPDLPSKPMLVNDFADMLSDGEEMQLETKLLNFANESSNEVTIVTVTDLGGMEVSEFARELGRKWDIGVKSRKNGVLLLASKNDRKINISPGDGLSGVLPDIICGQIIREEIVPNFRNGNFYQGFEDATTSIIKASKGEFMNDGSHSSEEVPAWVILLLFLGFFGFLFLMFYLRRKSGNIYVSRRGYKYNDGGWWSMPSSGTGWFNSGDWGGGSDSGGGGFGGFGGGGGGFNGGGASGSW